MLSVVKYFHKTLRLRCLTGFWMCLWMVLSGIADLCFFLLCNFRSLQMEIKGINISHASNLKICIFLIYLTFLFAKHKKSPGKEILFKKKRKKTENSFLYSEVISDSFRQKSVSKIMLRYSWIFGFHLRGESHVDFHGQYVIMTQIRWHK